MKKIIIILLAWVCFNNTWVNTNNITMIKGGKDSTVIYFPCEGRSYSTHRVYQSVDDVIRIIQKSESQYRSL